MVKIGLAASEKGMIGQAGGRIAVSSAQTRGKPVFDDAEFDFDAFSTPGTFLIVNWRSRLLKRPFSAYESHICYGGRQITLKILQKMVDFQLAI